MRRITDKKDFTLKCEALGSNPAPHGAGFTLVELLIVIGILAVLATTAVMVLNPAQFLAQSRDADRVSDLRTLEKAVSLAVLIAGATDNTQAQRVYLSLPDTNADTLCDEYASLPALSGGWEYRCMAPIADIRSVDGTGWVPIDLTSATDFDAPLTSLPVDPQNDETSYYAYAQGATADTFTFFTPMESTKYQDLETTDGGASDVYFETSPIAFPTGSTWASIAYGSEVVYNSGATTPYTVAGVDSSHFVSVYSDNGNSWYGTAIVGTVTGSSIAYGPEQVFNSATTLMMSVARLDATHVVIAYRDLGNSSYGTALVGTVTGTTLSFGPEYVFNTGTTAGASVTALDSTHIAVVYKDEGNSDYGTAVAGTITGSAIAFGAEYVFNNASTEFTTAAAVDGTHFAAAYRDLGNSNYGTAIVASVSGTTISFGSETVFNSSSVQYPVATGLDSGHVVIVYRDDPSNNGTAIVGTVTGTTIAFGMETIFNPANTLSLCVARMDASHFVTAYHDPGATEDGIAVVGSVSGTTVTAGSEYIFNGGLNNVSCAALDSTHFVVSYLDEDDVPNSGAAIVGYSP